MEDDKSNCSSFTSADTVRILLSAPDALKYSMEQIEKIKAASDARRGYSVATKPIEEPGELSLDAFVEWAKSIGKDVPEECRESATVDISYDMDYGLEITVSWRVP